MAELPVNIEAEQATVASVLIGGALALERAQKHVDASDFTRDEHRHLFLAAESLHSRSQPTDPVTLRTELTRMGVWPLFVVHGGETYIMRLIEMLPSAASVETYAKEVKRKSVLREAVGTCAHVSGLAYAEDADPEDVSNQLALYADRLGRRLAGGAARGEDETTEELVGMALEALYNPVRGLAYGIRELDYITELRPTETTIVAARTGNGKTALGIQTALYNAEKDKSVLFASYEMSRAILMQRIICQKARVDSRERVDATIRAKLDAAARHIARLPLRVVDQPSGYRLTPSRLLALCRRMGRKRPVDLLVVDYLQRVPADAPEHRMGGHIALKRENEIIASVSQALSDIPKDLNIPGLVLAQLNRESTREEEPQLQHIGGSTGIENDADVVLLPYPKEERVKGKPQAFQIIVAKQRNGAMGKADTHFTPWLTKFEPPEEVLLD